MLRGQSQPIEVLSLPPEIRSKPLWVENTLVDATRELTKAYDQLYHYLDSDGGATLGAELLAKLLVTLPDGDLAVEYLQEIAKYQGADPLTLERAVAAQKVVLVIPQARPGSLELLEAQVTSWAIKVFRGGSELRCHLIAPENLLNVTESIVNMLALQNGSVARQKLSAAHTAMLTHFAGDPQARAFLEQEVTVQKTQHHPLVRSIIATALTHVGATPVDVSILQDFSAFDKVHTFNRCYLEHFIACAARDVAFLAEDLTTYAQVVGTLAQPSTQSPLDPIEQAQQLLLTGCNESIPHDSKYRLEKCVEDLNANPRPHSDLPARLEILFGHNPLAQEPQEMLERVDVILNTSEGRKHLLRTLAQRLAVFGNLRHGTEILLQEARRYDAEGNRLLATWIGLGIHGARDPGLLQTSPPKPRARNGLSLPSLSEAVIQDLNPATEIKAGSTGRSALIVGVHKPLQSDFLPRPSVHTPLGLFVRIKDLITTYGAGHKFRSDHDQFIAVAQQRIHQLPADVFIPEILELNRAMRSYQEKNPAFQAAADNLIRQHQALINHIAAYTPKGNQSIIPTHTQFAVPSRGESKGVNKTIGEPVDIHRLSDRSSLDGLSIALQLLPSALDGEAHDALMKALLTAATAASEQRAHFVQKLLAPDREFRWGIEVISWSLGQAGRGDEARVITAALLHLAAHSPLLRDHLEHPWVFVRAVANRLDRIGIREDRLNDQISGLAASIRNLRKGLQELSDGRVDTTQLSQPARRLLADLDLRQILRELEDVAVRIGEHGVASFNYRSESSPTFYVAPGEHGMGLQLASAPPDVTSSAGMCLAVQRIVRSFSGSRTRPIRETSMQAIKDLLKSNDASRESARITPASDVLPSLLDQLAQLSLEQANSDTGRVLKRLAQLLVDETCAGTPRLTDAIATDHNGCILYQTPKTRRDILTGSPCGLSYVSRLVLEPALGNNGTAVRRLASKMLEDSLNNVRTLDGRLLPAHITPFEVITALIIATDSNGSSDSSLVRGLVGLGARRPDYAQTLIALFNPHRVRRFASRHATPETALDAQLQVNAPNPPSGRTATDVFAAFVNVFLDAENGDVGRLVAYWSQIRPELLSGLDLPRRQALTTSERFKNAQAEIMAGAPIFPVVENTRRLAFDIFADLEASDQESDIEDDLNDFPATLSTS